MASEFSSLITLTFADEIIIRCSTLDEAKEKAIPHTHEEGQIFVEIIPQGGGSMIILEYDRKSNDWVVPEDIIS